MSDESGEDRVYVRLYPDVGQAWTISSNGATAPQWSRNGREIFFIQNSQIMAASIDLSDGVRVGAPQALFSATAYEQDPFAVPMYDVAADGRFLMVRRGLGVRTWRFIQNWGTALAAEGSAR